MRTCREYWLRLMERMDARDRQASEPLDENDAELNAHLDQCADCRDAFAQSRAFVQALENAPRFAPIVPEGFADRTLERWRAEPSDASAPETPHTLRFAPARPRRRSWTRLSVAAAALLALSIGLSRLPRHQADPVQADRLPSANAALSTPSDGRSIDQAVASAGTATLDLAKETSAPVFRIGQRMFRTASLPQLPAISLPSMNLPAAAAPSAPAPAPESAPPAARRIFQFLRGSKS